MKGYKPKLLILPLLSLIIICLSMVFLYIFVLRVNVENTVYHQVDVNFSSRVDVLESKMKYDYSFFDSLSNDEIIELSSKESLMYSKIETNYNSVHTINFSDDQIVYNIEKKDSGDIIHYGVYVPLFNYLEDFSNESEYISEYYLFDYEMGTVYTTEDKKPYLYDYLDGGLKGNKELINNIVNTKKVLDDASFNGVKTKAYVSRVYVNEGDYLLLMVKVNQFNASSLISLFKTISIVFIVLLMIVGIIVTIVMIYQNIHNSQEMLMSIKRMTGACSYVILTTPSGVIKNYNVYVEKDFKEIKKCKNIMDLFDKQAVYSSNLLLTKKVDTKILFEDKYHYLHFYVTNSAKTIIFVGEDITDEYVEKQKLQHLVMINPVTKRENATALNLELHNILKNKKQILTSALIAIDIVHFDNLNSVFGRQIGNMVLNKISSIIEEKIDTDNLSLYNTAGDNFFVLGRNLENPKEFMINFVNELIHKFKEPMKIYNNLIVVKFKYGIYVFEEDVTKPEQIVDNTMKALKNAQGSRIQDYFVYDIHIGRIITKEMQMQADLVKAIENNEFVLYYQPQYSLKEKKVVGFESLIRWANPKYIGESPLAFIEMAEKNDLITQIGKFVIDDAMKTAKKYEDLGVSFSINISPAQLLQSGFVSELLNAAKINQVDPKKIAIEITETVMMELFDDVLDKLKEIKNYGFEIHLDDFGTGYSSLLYLNSLPVDVIKIDKEFIDNINDEETRLIVTKVIQMANGLNLRVIAEGVETKKESDFIEKAGGHEIQGYLISKPVPEDNIIDIIHEYNDEPKALGSNKKK